MIVGLLDLGTISGGSYTSFSDAGYYRPQPVKFDSDGNTREILYNNQSNSAWGPFNGMAVLNTDLSLNFYWPTPTIIKINARSVLMIMRKTIDLSIANYGSVSAGTPIGDVVYSLYNRLAYQELMGGQ